MNPSAGLTSTDAHTPRSGSAPRTLILMPAYNEADCVRRVVTDIQRTLPDCDILVIDDGSVDGTARQVPPPARVVSLPFNLGIGGAMQTGYRFAHLHGYDVAVQVDADGQHPAEYVPTLVEALRREDADLVIGSRFLDQRSYRPPPSRMAGITILRAVLRVLTGQAVTDCTSGFRAAGPRAIAAFAYWYPDDYPEPEVILLLERAGYKVTEAAVEMHPRTTGTTSISLLAGVFYVCKVTTALLLDLCRAPWPKGKVVPNALKESVP